VADADQRKSLQTKSDVWKSRVDGLLNHTLTTFFPKQIATEIICQNDEKDLCNTNAFTFKGFVCRWLATVAQVAPHTSDTIIPYLQASAKAAVSQCTGGQNGRTCGFQWLTGTYDGTEGCGQEMSALAAVISTMYPDAQAPLTNKTGGSSKGDSNAGSGGDGTVTLELSPITSGDRAGAWILTLLAVGGAAVGSAWVSTDLFEKFSNLY
jgi:mannan endo-1,6-alpha-mannosidase